MYLLSLSLSLLYLTAVLCRIDYNYTVLDTIGTDVFAYPENIEIYNSNQDECQLFQYEDGELRFSRVYDFNLEFSKLHFFCTVLIDDASGSITVYVTDTNNHSPEFLNTEYELYTLEQYFGDETFITIQLPTATDLDNAPYDVISYSLVGGSRILEYFSFSPVSPSLTSTRPIDREERSHFSFNLTASDGGTPSRNSSVAFIQIIVNDINDNIPQFLVHQTSFNISEDEVPGFTVGVFSAQDSDAGSNGEIMYLLPSQRAYKDGKELSVSEYLSPFRINDSTGEVTLFRELDFENFNYLEVTIEAQDLGTPQLFELAQINVRVIDASEPDKPSQLIFTNVPTNETILMVEENQETNFLSLISLEPDLPPGAKASVTVMTYPDNSSAFPFSVHTIMSNSEWNLQFSGSLDRELVSMYELLFQLIVTNLSNVADRTSFSRLTVIISDVNDNPPRLVSPPLECISVPENTLRVIYTLSATDNDIGINANLEYSVLISQGYESYFSVNSSSGVVELITELDYEEVSMFDLNLGVTDKGMTPLTDSITVSVCVENLNDNPIIFGLTNYVLPVNSPLHTKLLTVQASDRDDPYQPIYYNLDPVHNETFQLDPVTGDLFLIACLPHGLVERQFSASHCPDPKNTSLLCELSHTIISINVTEREAILLYSSYTVCLESNKTINSTLSLLSTDSSSVNGTNLTISTNGSHFTVNVVDNHDSLVSDVTCTDSAICDITFNHECDSNHTELTSLNILFVSELDSSIQFTEDVYEISLDEGEYVNFTLRDFSQFVCFDNFNSPVFSIPGEHQESLFTLTQSGLLFISGSVDVDSINATNNYTLSIHAESNDVITTTTLYIIITPINDNTPQFFNSSQRIRLTYYFPNYLVTQFKARDLDIGIDGMLVYRLTIELNWLVLNETTGVLAISNNFSADTEFVTNKTYYGNITVSDRGYPPRQNSLTFSLFLNDRIEIYPPQSYWYIVTIPILLLTIILFVLIVIVLVVLYVWRCMFCFKDEYRLDSAKSSHVWEVLKNNNASDVRESVTQNARDPPVYSTPRSSGIGISINSTSSTLVPMTDEEIKQIIDANKDLVKECGSIPTLHDYNEESPAPPTLAGEDSDLHLVFGDDVSQASNSASDKRSQFEPPIDLIFANPDTRYLEPSHSPQSSASSSYLSSVSHQRPRLPYYNASPREVVKRPEISLVPLPSSSTPSFSRNVLVHSQQPDTFDSLEVPI